MEFDKDVFYLFTQLSVIYGGTVDDFDQELNETINDGFYSRDELLTAWKLLVDNKISELMQNIKE